MSARDKLRYAKDKRPQGGFVALPYIVLRSQQFTALSPHGVKLLLDLLSQYNGGNNGDLAATWNVMEKRGWRSRDTLWKALRELLNAGWIAQTRQGGLHAPSLYGVTIFALDESPKLDIRATDFPRGAWARARSAALNTPSVSINGASSNTHGVSPMPESTRPPCQPRVPEVSIDTPSERIKAVSRGPVTRLARASIDLPSLGDAATYSPPSAAVAADPVAADVVVFAARPSGSSVSRLVRTGDERIDSRARYEHKRARAAQRKAAKVAP